MNPTEFLVVLSYMMPVWLNIPIIFAPLAGCELEDLYGRAMIFAT
jgi:hypothetical protein